MAVPGRDTLLRYALAGLCFAAAAVGFAMLPAHGDCGACTPPPRHCDCASATIVVPAPNVPAPNLVVMNNAARASAQASAQSFAISVARTGDTIIHNGGAFAESSSAAFAVNSVSFSVVEAGAGSSARATRIQAMCVDSAHASHPASQTFGGEAVAEDYAGEIYRCASGTMRVNAQGRSFECGAGQALWYERAQLSCRTQIERRPGNEHALLRRFGSGDKVARLRETPTFNAAMAMDGGVGAGLN